MMWLMVVVRCGGDQGVPKTLKGKGCFDKTTTVITSNITSSTSSITSSSVILVSGYIRCSCSCCYCGVIIEFRFFDAW